MTEWLLLFASLLGLGAIGRGCYVRAHSRSAEEGAATMLIIGGAAVLALAAVGFNWTW